MKLDKTSAVSAISVMRTVALCGVLALAAAACWTESKSSPATTPVAPVTPEQSPPPGEPVARATTRTVRDIVQPVRIEKQAAPFPVEGDADGVEGGEEGGIEDGTWDDVVAAPPPPPPPPPPPVPMTVAPAALDALRIAGDKNIIPDDLTKTQISRSGKNTLVGTYKLCITATGDIKSVAQLKGTGFPAYDSKIQNTIRAEWRYRPFLANNKPEPVCTAVTFIYRQTLPPPPPPPSQPSGQQPPSRNVP